MFVEIVVLAVVAHDRIVERQDAGSACPESVGRHKELAPSEASTPILYLLLRSEWMALLGTNILTSELCHTPSVAPRVEGPDVGVGIVVLEEEASVGRIAGQYAGRVRIGEPATSVGKTELQQVDHFRIPEERLVGENPRCGNRRIERPAVAGSKSVVAEVGESEFGHITIVITVIDPAVIVQVVVLIGENTVAVVSRDVEIDRGIDGMPAELAVIAQRDMPLLPVLHAVRTVTAGLQRRIFVGSGTHSVVVTGIVTGLRIAARRICIERESLAQIESFGDEVESLDELEITLQHPRLRLTPPKGIDRSDRIAVVG